MFVSPIEPAKGVIQSSNNDGSTSYTNLSVGSKQKKKKKKILIIGGNGTIGKKVTEYFKSKYEVLIGGRTNSDVEIDISKSQSIENAFSEIGKLDAIICIAGEAKWDKFENLTEEDYYIGLRSKLMGQVNLVRIGRKYLNSKGSIYSTR